MRLLGKRDVLATKPFTVEELQLARDDRPLDHPYYRLTTTDWVNILPILPDGRALLIRQFRAGALRPILEVPGGMVDAGEKDAMMAALRELEEETGYTSQRVLPLGTINPNPAIMSNRTHFFLALAAMPNPSRKHFPDAEERIELELVPATDLDLMVRTGQIDHALAALCIMLAGKYIDIGMTGR
jgi:8-oxo-dGTP pyrophosphatase MutT (NUDIX family)